MTCTLIILYIAFEFIYKNICDKKLPTMISLTKLIKYFWSFKIKIILIKEVVSLNKVEHKILKNHES